MGGGIIKINYLGGCAGVVRGWWCGLCWGAIWENILGGLHKRSWRLGAPFRFC